MGDKRKLPRGFAALEGLVEDWVLEDSQARADKRISSDYADIDSFYKTMLTHAPTVLDYLRQRRLGELKKKEERLLKLMLALAEVGPAVEWYRQARVKDGFEPDRFRLTVQLPDVTSQETMT